ncbi:MAG: peptidoglycan DD-metalloendopeptidase family protein [Thiopseudomonas sp.]|nr:peptidoglycan DD-metalloendopeptidase family protein [Thiopseudomonas sp.]
MTKGALFARAGRFGCMAAGLALLLAGCTGSGNAPVVDRQHNAQGSRTVSARPVTSGSYRVQPKDTLYSIAFRLGRDWKELAAINGIAAPYTIKPGQVIQLSRKTSTRAVATKPVAKPVSKPATPPASKPASKPAPTPTTPASKPAATQKPTAVPSTAGKWQWPAEGAVISRFSSGSSLNKGIDIAGRLGQPVRASSKGTVVYAGGDLRGYGEMVIINHDDTYISAYGHNRRLLVNEGQQVSAGQQIAEMGSTGTDQVKLHFEIRRQGSPVDPLQYLPKR